MSQDTPRRLEIKKYPNRRYYDATHSRHLTLEEIRNLIQQGHDIKVVDARTSTDITAQVLTQLILELDASKLESFPVPLLLRVIRMNDQLVKDFIEKYFNQALSSFLSYQQQVEEQIRKTHGLPTVFPSVAAWTKAMLEPLATAFTPTVGGVAPEASSPESPLAQQVKDLQEQVEQLRRRGGGRKKAARKRSR